MTRSHVSAWVLAASAALALGTDRSTAADWPEFRGPNRDGISKETGLLKEWPKGGPKQLWTAKNLGLGFGTPSVADGKIFGLGTRDGKDGVWALKESDGTELWFTPFDDPRNVNQNNGPSSTPTFHEGKLFVLSSKGKLACLDAKTGETNWKADLVKDFGGSIPGWGYTESLLIDGDKLICTPGGKTPIVALDKKSGQVVWKAAFPKAEGAHYSSALAVEIGGRRQYVQFMRGGVVSVGASDGEFLWRYDHPANGTANCSTPLVKDGAVFAASSYGTGGGLVQVSKTDSKFEAKESYFDKKMQSHHGGLVLVGDHIYGAGEGIFRCINFKTGELAWEDRKPGKGSVTYADGHLYFHNEGGKGSVVLIEANPKEYVEKGRFDPAERSKLSAWAYPVVANGKLYIRDQNVLSCYDIKK